MRCIFLDDSDWEWCHDRHVIGGIYPCYCWPFTTPLRVQRGRGGRSTRWYGHGMRFSSHILLTAEPSVCPPTVTQFACPACPLGHDVDGDAQCVCADIPHIKVMTNYQRRHIVELQSIYVKLTRARGTMSDIWWANRALGRTKHRRAALMSNQRKCILQSIYLRNPINVLWASPWYSLMIIPTSSSIVYSFRYLQRIRIRT